MKFILTLILLLIFGGVLSGAKDCSNNKVRKSDPHYPVLTLLLLLIFGGASSKGKSKSDNKRKNSSSFDPYDTFYLEDGFDHQTDDDSYCDECDDYHY